MHVSRYYYLDAYLKKNYEEKIEALEDARKNYASESENDIKKFLTDLETTVKTARTQVEKKNNIMLIESLNELLSERDMGGTELTEKKKTRSIDISNWELIQEQESVKIKPNVPLDEGGSE